MIIKKREPSKDIIKTRYLLVRLKGSENELRQLLYEEKGYEGEVAFDKLIDLLPQDNFLRIADLTFEINHSYAQADAIILSPTLLHLFEIKNFEGEHYLEDGKFNTSTGYELKSPLEQCNRTESLLRKKLQQIGIKIPIQSYVFFIHPEFTLFQAPKQDPKFVLPTQIPSFIRKFNNHSSPVTKNQIEVANKLMTFQTESPYSRIPTYSYERLEKGIYCNKCRQFSLRILEKKAICQTCSHEESIRSTVIRGVTELLTLFPELRITLSLVKDWCRLKLTDRQYKYILQKYFEVKSKGRFSYYFLNVDQDHKL